MKSTSDFTCIFCGAQILAGASHNRDERGPSHLRCPRLICLHCHRPIVRGGEVHEAPAGYAHRECSQDPLTPQQVAQSRVRFGGLGPDADAVAIRCALDGAVEQDRKTRAELMSAGVSEVCVGATGVADRLSTDEMAACLVARVYPKTVQIQCRSCRASGEARRRPPPCPYCGAETGIGHADLEGLWWDCKRCGTFKLSAPQSAKWSPTTDVLRRRRAADLAEFCNEAERSETVSTASSWEAGYAAALKSIGARYFECRRDAERVLEEVSIVLAQDQRVAESGVAHARCAECGKEIFGEPALTCDGEEAHGICALNRSQKEAL